MLRYIANIQNNPTVSQATLIDTDGKGHYSNLTPYGQYSPTMYTKGDKTVFTIQGNLQNGRENYIYTYDHTLKTLSEPSVMHPNVDGDYHGICSILILDDGNGLLFRESEHSVELEIYKTDAPWDYDNYSLVHTITEGGPAYPNPHQIGGRIFMNYRGSANKNYITYSDDDGDTWSTPRLIAQTRLGGYWMYPRQIFSNDKYRTFSSVYHTGRARYWKGYYYETTDGETYSNIDGSFTKNIITQGHITWQELDAHFLVFEDSINNVVIGANWLGTDGIVRCHVMDKIYSFENGLWGTKVLASSEWEIMVAGQSTVMQQGQQVELVCNAKNPQGEIKPVIVATQDNFDSFTIKMVLDDEYLYPPVTPFNFTEHRLGIFPKRQYIAPGANFQDPTDGYSDFYITEL